MKQLLIVPLTILLMVGCARQKPGDDERLGTLVQVAPSAIVAEWEPYGTEQRFVEYRMRVDLLSSLFLGRRHVRDEVIVRVTLANGEIRHYLQSTTQWVTTTPLCESFPQASYRDGEGNFREKP